ncbi:PREDICTED: interleukin-31 [Miniopterus natalensis]|uniref:interleukin-31 n=1 Tax=Miniopterus natalensis TaxID=291302 RepID=UPI0007A6E309|nr:PREDICTED: interleukin-31 [Miniopterus natalensis]
MVSRPGPTGCALFLLCCMGPVLFIHMAPISVRDLRSIIIELKVSSQKLLDSYKEQGLPPTGFQLPSFTAACQHLRLHHNGSAVLPYVRAARPLLQDKPEFHYIVQQLSKLSLPRAPEASVAVPTDSFDYKRFVLAVLNEFSDCMKRL